MSQTNPHNYESHNQFFNPSGIEFLDGINNLALYQSKNYPKIVYEKIILKIQQNSQNNPRPQD